VPIIRDIALLAHLKKTAEAFKNMTFDEQQTELARQRAELGTRAANVAQLEKDQGVIPVPCSRCHGSGCDYCSGTGFEP
jgi:hypothetical protein